MSLDKGQMPNLNVSGLKIAVVASRFNKELVDALLSDAVKTLLAKGIAESDITVMRVPGAAELPFMCGSLAKTGKYDAAVALGVVIAGETPHHEIIANSTAVEMQRLASETGVPMINGIIVTNNLEQAQNRTIGKIARGVEFAEAAMEMAFHASNFKNNK